MHAIMTLALPLLALYLALGAICGLWWVYEKARSWLWERRHFKGGRYVP